MNITDHLSCSQIICENPILQKEPSLKQKYFNYINLCLSGSKLKKEDYAKACLKVYKNLLILQSNDNLTINDFYEELAPYRLLIYLDILAISGYNKAFIKTYDYEKIKEKICRDFTLNNDDITFFKNIEDMFRRKSLKMIYECNCGSTVAKYLRLFYKNMKFINEKPIKILVTATMSAGKSTFINALTGKNVSLAQNMACTSKIHSIISKPYDDEFTSEYDHNLTIDAKKENLLFDDELNKRNEIIVSTYFSGNLGGKRFIINDSPGVNYSENSEHKKITNNLVKGGEYDLVIYVLNASQLGTNDEKEHLLFVKRYLKNKRIIFVINKVDVFNSEDENIIEVINKTKDFIKSIGFDNPIICPVSAKAGCLAKKSRTEKLKMFENRELTIYEDDFHLMNLPLYYEKELNIKVETSFVDEIEQLIYECGLGYIEKIII